MTSIQILLIDQRKKEIKLQPSCNFLIDRKYLICYNCTRFMKANSVTKNTTYLTSSYIWQKILSFFYFVLIARFIGVEDLGKYSFALSFTALFAVVVDMGLNQVLIRESAKFLEKSKNYLSSILTVKILSSAIVYGLIIVIINLMNYPALTKQLVYIAGVVMIFDQFANTFWGVFRGRQNLKWESINIVINQTIIVIVGVIVLFLKLPLIYLMLPFVASSLFSFIFSGVIVRKLLGIKYKLQFDRQVLAFLFKIALPFVLIAVFSRVYGYIDTVMLSKMIGDKAVGWYSVAMKIPFALQFIPAALAASIYPAFSHHFLHDKKQLKVTFDRVVRFLVIIVLPISAGVAVLANPIVKFFYGIEYLPSVLPLQIMMMGLFFVFINFPLGALLNGCDRQVTNTKLVGATMILNVVLNLILIPQYSFVGASIAFLASHTVLFIGSMIIARQIIPYRRRILLATFIKSFASGLAMVAVIMLLKNWLHFTVLIVIGAIVYFAVIYFVREITREDIKYFKDFLVKRKNV